MRTVILLLTVLIAVLAPVGAAPQASSQSTQPATSVVESYTRARAIVDAAVKAHGGASALTALDTSRVVLEGPEYFSYQSRRVTPQSDQDIDRVELLLDLPKQRLLQNRWRTFPGGVRRNSGFITDGARGFFVNFRQGTHATSAYPAAATQTGNLYYMPQYVLRDLRSQPSALRWLGRMRLHTGDEVEVVTGATASGPGTVTAAFDPTTRLLRATLSPTTDPLAGDVASEIHYVGYRTLNGVLVPTRRLTYVNRIVTRDLRYAAVEPGYQIPAAALVPPVGSVDTTNAPSTPQIQAVAPGIWTVGGVSALVVAFSDNVLVVDAPSGAANIINQIATLAPGKPIRYVVPTHHHDDHSSGVRQFVAAGATIVTAAANRSFMESMARTSPVPIEVMTSNTRIFTDGRRTVEIHNIGSGPHAEDMLVAWIPEEGVLFQADLIDGPIGGVLGPGANNETTMHFASWLKARNWSVKVFAGSHGSLPSPEAFEALIKTPIIPLR